MELDQRACDRARRSRDPRFDGRFFIGVTSTRIYCRPICPARAPKDEHVRYFPSAAAAEVAGFRPCLRCRPEASPGTPAWLGTSSLVSRALRLIHDGALDDGGGVEQLAERLGVSGRHLRRLFLQNLGATPRDVALTRRLHFAKKLLDETELAMTDVAFAAGFHSLRRFNSQFRSTYSRTPTELRRLARQHVTRDPERYRFRLAYRPPYDAESLLAFLEARAIPGVERVEAGRYRRTIELDGKHGLIDVSPDTGAALRLEVRFPDPRALLSIVERVRRLFDLGADPDVIGEHLAPDPLLRPLLAARPGVRSPGCWDAFEIAVREILEEHGPAAAAAACGRIASAFGAKVAEDDGLERLFPPPAQLANAALELAGVRPGAAETIRRVARAASGGALASGTALESLPGIAASCAARIAMRAPGEPDAFPSEDPALRRAAGGLTADELERRSDAWRPWRAYAAMLLWRSADAGREEAAPAGEVALERELATHRGG